MTRKDTLNERQTRDDAESRRSMKVTDRRMFTPEGELREEYRHLEEGAAAAAEADAPAPEPPVEEPSPPPDEPENEAEAATFQDLLSLLAEHASVYLRQASMPGSDPQSMELARLHIDLIAVVKDKTRGNLDAQEQAMLDDVLYRLRMAATGNRGF